jgi:hypothetical protein
MPTSVVKSSVSRRLSEFAAPWTRLLIGISSGATVVLVRICGNGGVYSFIGWYWSKRLGRFRAYVTDLHRTVVLTFPHGRIVLSPDRPEAFVEALTRNRQLRG